MSKVGPLEISAQCAGVLHSLCRPNEWRCECICHRSVSEQTKKRAS